MDEKQNMIYISHLLPDEEMKKLVMQTGAGVESIDFSISDNLDHVKETIQVYKSRLDTIGTTELTIHGPFLDLNPAAYDSEISRVTELRFAQSYEAALELGAAKIVYHSCYYPQIYFLEGWAERVADFMNRFLENRTELEVDMENVLDPQWKPLARLAELVEADNFGICLDVGHANCYSKEPVIDWAQGLATYIRHVHIHDNGGDRDAHLRIGAGNIPFSEIFDILQKHNDGRRMPTWTIECQSMDDVEESVNRFYVFSKKQFSRKQNR